MKHYLKTCLVILEIRVILEQSDKQFLKYHEVYRWKQLRRFHYAFRELPTETPVLDCRKLAKSEHDM